MGKNFMNSAGGHEICLPVLDCKPFLILAECAQSFYETESGHLSPQSIFPIVAVRQRTGTKREKLYVSMGANRPPLSKTNTISTDN
jgi:hypothetical protein